MVVSGAFKVWQQSSGETVWADVTDAED